MAHRSKSVARRQGHQDHRHRAPVTPSAAAPHMEAVVLALAPCAAVAVVGSAALAVVGIIGHHAKGLRQMEFNECEAVVLGHDGFRVQVRVTQGPQHTLGREIRVKRSNVVRVEKPATNMAPRPQSHHKPWLVGTKQPTVPHTGGKDLVADMPNTMPGN